MTLRESYETLELQPGASLEEIRRAYRRLAAAWHPDRFPQNPDRRKEAAERFKAVGAAYARLRSASQQERAAVGSPSATRSVSRSSRLRRGAVARRAAFAGHRRRGVVERGSLQTADEQRYRHDPLSTTGSVSDGTYQRGGPATHQVAPRTTSGAPAQPWFEGWLGVVVVAAAVGAFCLGILRSASLAEMLAWTAMWAVMAAGAIALSSGEAV